MEHFVELIKQQKGNCAQTCLSMLTGFSMEDIEALTGREEGLSLSNIKGACGALGIEVIGDWRDSRYGKWGYYPPTCLIHVQPHGSNNTHLILRGGNTYYDPNGYQEYEFPRYRHSFLKYLEVKSHIGYVPFERYDKIRNIMTKLRRGATLIKFNPSVAKIIIDKQKQGCFSE